MSKNTAKILALTASLLALVQEDLQSAEAPAANPTPSGGGRRGRSAPTPEPEPEPEPEAEPEPEPEPEAEPESTVTIEALREKAGELLTAGKRPELLKVLAKYKVKALKDLNAKHYEAVAEAFDGIEIEEDVS
jgi:hypothetical protein